MSEIGHKFSCQESKLGPADVLVAIVVYIPHLKGYFTNRLAVLRLCLDSLYQTTPNEVEFLVFDNGSCTEVEGYLSDLVRHGDLNYLYRSHLNIGKLAAMRLIFQLATREVVAFSDDDIFFYPKWLESQLAILNNFPKVGMVSGVPTLDGAGFALDSTLNIAKLDTSISLTEEAYIPEEWEADWAASTGRDPGQRAIEARRTKVAKLMHNGIEAYVGATHFQFLSFVSRIVSCLPEGWPSNLMGGMRELDSRINQSGYLRLSTVRRWVRHLGNHIHPNVRREALHMGLDVVSPVFPPHLTIVERLPMKSGRVRSWGRKLYRRLGLILDGKYIENIPWRSNPE